VFLCCRLLQFPRCCSCTVLQEQLVASFCVSVLPSVAVYQVSQLQCVARALIVSFCVSVLQRDAPGVAVAVCCNSSFVASFCVFVLQSVAVYQVLHLYCVARAVGGDFLCLCLVVCCTLPRVAAAVWWKSS